MTARHARGRLRKLSTRPRPRGKQCSSFLPQNPVLTLVSADPAAGAASFYVKGRTAKILGAEVAWPLLHVCRSTCVRAVLRANKTLLTETGGGRDLAPLTSGYSLPTPALENENFCLHKHAYTKIYSSRQLQQDCRPHVSPELCLGRGGAGASSTAPGTREALNKHLFVEDFHSSCFALLTNAGLPWKQKC